MYCPRRIPPVLLARPTLGNHPARSRFGIVVTQVAPLPSPASAATARGWRAIAPSALPRWSARLLETPASLFQYPYWNEPLRALHFAPQYLTYHDGKDALAYACVLRLGVPGARIGLVQRGPVGLRADGAVPAESLHDLQRWGRSNGYMFLRFTHDDADLLDQVEQAGDARRIDAFPFYREPQEELLVEQHDDDDAVLRGFQPVARRNLKKALEAGFQLESSDDPQSLSAVWPLFERLAHRKRLSFRPEASYRTIVELARPHDGARVHVARLGDRTVQAILVVRDRDRAHYISGALDTEALGDTPSPSVLLHWQAMRDAYRRWGCTHYDLGTRSGNVYPFKRKFRPVERHCPPPATLVINRTLFGMWFGAGLPAITRHWPRIKRTLSRSGRSPAARAPEPAGEPADE
jgi:hypothetical protein